VRRPRGSTLFALAASASLALAGCQDILNAILANAAPVGVSASDGDYDDEIRVSWGAPSLSGDKWKDYSVAGYEVRWSWANGGTGAAAGLVSGTGYAIPAAGRRAEYCTVTVETRLSGGSLSSGGEASDRGFAISTQDLAWPDGGADYAISGSDQWYVTMLQRGFDYGFAFAGGGAGTVELYPYKTLDRCASFVSSPGSSSWTCDQDGAGNWFYVRVSPGSPGNGFRASYGF
jgi:hypothetical protein